MLLKLITEPVGHVVHVAPRAIVLVENHPADNRTRIVFDDQPGKREVVIEGTADEFVEFIASEQKRVRRESEEKVVKA